MAVVQMPSAAVRALALLPAVAATTLHTTSLPWRDATVGQASAVPKERQVASVSRLESNSRVPLLKKKTFRCAQKITLRCFVCRRSGVPLLSVLLVLDHFLSPTANIPI